ncbi:MAG: hypothetical protein KF696_08495 [Planctomycetes bacterium]|nr:hypothetical protein [Planctomycetota bacterium]MCW8135611.1 hypothetical protein [Planctomycetota bacterium]
MRYAIVAMLLMLPGCALLDGLLGTTTVQATDDHGRPIYEDLQGQPTHLPADPATGQPHQPRTITLVNPDGAASVADWLGGLGPWGALAGALATFGAGAYARVRNRQRLREAGMRKQAEDQLDATGSALTFALRMIEKIKQGEAIDADNDGRVSLKEVRQWVRSQGASFEDPRYLADLVKIANQSLPTAAERKALRGA